MILSASPPSSFSLSLALLSNPSLSRRRRPPPPPLFRRRRASLLVVSDVVDSLSFARRRYIRR